MGILINPLDTIFFRDGKPFSMGAETWADGVFPPYPGTVLGAIRTLVLSGHEGGFTIANTMQDPTMNLRLTGLGYHILDEVHFPLPLDCVQNKEDAANLVSTLHKQALTEKMSNNKLPCILTPPTEAKVTSVPDGLIPAGVLTEYLNTGRLSCYCERMGEFITTEPKTGIGRDNVTRTSSEGKLYRVGMIRLESRMHRGSKTKSLKIAVELSHSVLPDTTLLKLGAESKISAITNSDFPEIKKATSAPERKNIKLYLATPAIFNDGALPSFSNHPLLKEFRITVQAAATGKARCIGGFDMKQARPKAMMRAVPAGSVYYVHCEEGYNSLADAIHGKSISDERGAEGFGIVYAGVQPDD